MAGESVAARERAVYLLDRVMGDGQLLPEVLSSGALDALPAPDRARAQRLALETLRGLEQADRLLQRHLRKQPPLTVRNVLRLGTVELCSGGAAHGVVNDCVQIVAQSRRHSKLKGLVNAVLRKIADGGPAVWPTLRVPRLPKWLRGPLSEAWGADAIGAIEAAHFAGAPLDLTIKSNPEDLATALGGMVLPTGSVRVPDAGQVSALPGFDAGTWWVQDAAAALPVKMLAPQKGERIVDLCAAPGGKTLQLAAAGADVTAVDSSAHRMKQLAQNLARCELDAETVVSDARGVTGSFDAVLLDAPCSATGTIRRHPDLPYAKDGSGFSDLIAQQSELLDHAWSLVKPGGRLVYCTCSLLPDEGEIQVEEALARHADMSVDSAASDLPGVEAHWRSAEGGVRLRPDFWPEQGGMDGFYIASLRKLA